MGLIQTTSDIAIIGGGAAGLAVGIFAGRRWPGASIVVLDGARKVGAKILVSGGGRCNVINAVVTPEDYWGGSANVIRRVLRALPVERTVAFFREIGVELHEEPNGKLFPDSNSARTVLEALLSEAGRVGVRVLTEHRVEAIERVEAWGEQSVNSRESGYAGRDSIAIPEGGQDARPPGRQDTRSSGRQDVRSPAGQEDCPPAGFAIETGRGVVYARKVVLATGGQSLPKTGSDGFGYELARRLGHSIVPTTPALAPLVLEGDFHARLTGVSQEVELTIRVENADQPLRSKTKPVPLTGSLLWTHFGISGPVAMNASRHWHRARLEGRTAHITANLLPGECFESLERRLIGLVGQQPRTALHNALVQAAPAGPDGRSMLPARVAVAVLEEAGISPQIPLAHLSREQRRRLVHALLEWPLPVRDSRGYNYAEATAGGVPLDEINPATMESRKCPGLFLVGEILDVDGRIGGFNFQWAWASAYVAAGGLLR